MLTKVRVLLHICSNIIQDPEKITESINSFGAFKLSAVDRNYREIEDYTMNLDITKPNDLIKMINDIPFQSIADQLTKDFGCPSVYVQPPKITSRGVLITYCRGELERNMLFLKIVFEEPD
ncbi:MAG: hypothetical protein QG674_290 [Patescibacteria group bacterium]|jgi:hypothetical protein|nr:hypothetical protein [Patescibacteria group bacterium]